MKAEEVMLGDWIAYIPEIADGEDSYLGEPRPIQVNMSSFTRMEELIFKPILLTPEILEKNGFWENSFGRRQHDRYNVALSENDDTFFIWERIPVMYVHEFQHALRLCGLTDLAEKFEV